MIIFCTECCTGWIEIMNMEVYTVHQSIVHLVKLLSLIILERVMPSQSTSQVSILTIKGVL